MHNYVDQLRFITELQWAILKKKHCCQTLEIKTNAEVIFEVSKNIVKVKGHPTPKVKGHDHNHYA